MAAGLDLGDKRMVSGGKIKDLHRHTQLAVKNGDPFGYKEISLHLYVDLIHFDTG
ncbi:hypothetical protein MASR1M90_10610 [Desulfovibrionales bacterium]